MVKEEKAFNQNCLIKYRAVLMNRACFSVFLLCVFVGVRCTLNRKQQTGVPLMLEVQSPLHVM